MTKEDLRACADELVDFHKRFAPCFGRIECQGHAFHYLQGLLLAPKGKSVEPMALQFAEGNVIPMQRFVTRGVWDAAAVQREVQAVAAERLAPSAAGAPEGAVLVIDESAFAKKGTHSVGVSRQHNGRLGKVDNCQVGVFLAYATPAGTALVDHRLYLPRTQRRVRRSGPRIRIVARKRACPTTCHSARSPNWPATWWNRSGPTACCRTTGSSPTNSTEATGA